jgi:hypothetical protein
VLRKRLKILLAIVFSIAMFWVYFNRIKPASKAVVLLQSGLPVKANAIGTCVPFPMPIGRYYRFFVNNERYESVFNLHNRITRIGDTIDVLYLPENPDLNMSKEDVKIYASSVWSIFTFSKPK